MLSIIITASSNAQLLLNQPNEIIPNNLNGNLNYNNISISLSLNLKALKFNFELIPI